MPSWAFMLHRQVHIDSLLRSITDKGDMGYVARETSPYWPLISSRISHIKNEYPIYFLSTKKVGWKCSTCNDKIVSTRNMTTCWILNDLVSGKMWFTYNAEQVHDDALLRSRGTTLDIGYAAREAKPDWPLIRHNILLVIIEYAINFFPSKKVGWKSSTCNS